MYIQNELQKENGKKRSKSNQKLFGFIDFHELKEKPKKKFLEQTQKSKKIKSKFEFSRDKVENFGLDYELVSTKLLNNPHPTLLIDSEGRVLWVNLAFSLLTSINPNHLDEQVINLLIDKNTSNQKIFSNILVNKPPLVESTTRFYFCNSEKDTKCQIISVYFLL
jgi:hypothetical protein